MKKYFLSTDNSGHWYIVDADHREEWEEWCELDDNDERGWEAPDFAYSVGGCPGQVEFSLDLEEEKKWINQ